MGPIFHNYALALVGAQRLDETRAQAQAAVKADPNHAESHTLLGELLARDQRLAEAVSEYQQAVKLQPDFSRVHLDLGLVLAAQGDLRGATEHLRKSRNRQRSECHPASNPGTSANRQSLGGELTYERANLCEAA